MPESPDKPGSAGTGLLLAVPLLACCGLPILVAAAAAVGAAIVAPAAGAMVLVGVVAFLLVRRRRAAACCTSERPVAPGGQAASTNGKAPTIQASGSRPRAGTLRR